jgi:hypothetical protein
MKRTMECPETNHTAVFNAVLISANASSTNNASCPSCPGSNIKHSIFGPSEELSGCCLEWFTPSDFNRSLLQGSPFRMEIFEHVGEGSQVSEPTHNTIEL